MPFAYDVIDDHTVRLRLADAMEFLTRFSYTDNWLSETHEQFCGFSWADWVQLAGEVGLQVDPRSGPWRNEWLVANVFEPAAALFDDDGNSLDWPVTHVFVGCPGGRGRAVAPVSVRVGRRRGSINALRRGLSGTLRPGVDLPLWQPPSWCP